MASLARVEDELVDFVGGFYGNPLGFVMACYPWGEKGPLERHTGPDEWQRKQLLEIGEAVKRNAFDGSKPCAPLRWATSSGHGIGKSTLAAWLVDWIMSTRPGAQGTITANTFDQLETKTWAAVQRWTGLCLTSHWFLVTSRKMYHPDYPSTWFCAPQSCKEENSEAFAGQHAENSTSFYIFDEDSAVPDKIHEVSEGGLTDGEPMVFRFGNPTRNSGDFHKACFGSARDRWHVTVVDSRDSKFTNKDLIAEWIKDYGEDSDFVRVRVRGLPPRASELQFIEQDRIWNAQKRSTIVLGDEPLVCGVDISDGGSAWNVIRFRRGADARSIRPIRIPGSATQGDRSTLLAKLADVLTTDYGGVKVHTMFVDSAFGAPYVERLQAMGHRNVVEVRFGATSNDSHQANMRAYMWARMKEWLGSRGMIEEADSTLEIDLTSPGYHINKQDKLVIESKEDMAKRGVASPDDGDALALTFAANVATYRAVGLGPQPKEWAWA